MSRIGDAGRSAEKRLGKRLNMPQVPASGAANGNKGDLDDGRVLMEVKSTIKDRYPVTLNVLEKINSEALMAGRLPALAIQFTDDKGRAKQSWVAVPEWVWAQLQVVEE